MKQKLLLFLLVLMAAVQTVSAQEFYYVMSGDGSTFTYYYDGQRTSRGGKTLSGDGLMNTEQTVKVVFDSSVANYKPTSTSAWFSDCSALTTIEGLQYLNTENVWMMNTMFMGCKSLTSLDLSTFNTSKVTSMYAMFQGCTALKSVNLTSFDTSKATNMEGLFAYCSSLTSLDLSSFNTANVTNMAGMFAECSSLKTIYADESRWSTASLEDTENSMFYNCDAPITGGNGTDYWDTYYADDATYARIDKAGQPGYLTHKAGPALPDPEPYAVRSENGTVLTFYYDGNKESRGGMEIRPFEYLDADQKLIWGTNLSQITTVNFDVSFAQCTSVTSTAYWFFECTNLATINGLEYLNTSNVTDMTYMFGYCAKLESLDLSTFDTRNVESMSDMFYRCTGLKTLNVSSFDTGKVEGMGGMFENCDNVMSLDVSGFNTANVISMYRMFYECGNVTALDVSGFDTGKVTSMVEMFCGCKLVPILDVSHFNTENVTSMARMFSGCLALTSLDVSSFYLGKVTNMNNMFYYCPNLTTIYCDKTWTTNTSTSMFGACSKLKGAIEFDTEKTDVTYANPTTGYFTWKNGQSAAPREPYAVLSENNTVLTFYYDSKKEDHKGAMGVGPFSSAFNENGPAWYWPSRNYVKTVVFDETFADCTTITSTAFWFYSSNVSKFEGLENLNTENVTNMQGMFYYCDNLTDLDVSSFNTSKVTNMNSMFGMCLSLASLDLSGFDFSNVTNMYKMFENDHMLETILFGNSKTSKLTNMSCMFWMCNGLKNIDLPNFMTDEVTDMSNAFYYCNKLVELDLSNFNTSKVTKMDGMFEACEALKTIYSNDVWNCTSSNNMFNRCNSLKGAIAYDSNKTDVTYANPTMGYFTAKNAPVDPTVCAKPVIAIVDGKITITCATEGAQFETTVSKSATGSVLTLDGTYTISVKATKGGLEDSEVATAEIKLADSSTGKFEKGDVNEDGQVNYNDVEAVVNIILKRGGASAGTRRIELVAPAAQTE